MTNILSGGLHAGPRHGRAGFSRGPDARRVDRRGDPPDGARALRRDRRASRPRHADAARRRGRPGPGCATARAALRLMIESIERAGLRPGDDVSIAIDVAATSLRAAGWPLRPSPRRPRVLDSDAMIDMVARWVREVPVVSVEDGLGEEDWAGWRTLTQRLGDTLQLVGDDLFATHPQRLARGVARRRRQRRPRQGEPERHADRHARRHRAGEGRRLRDDRVRAIGRDRGRVHGRPRRRDSGGPDQDRLAAHVEHRREIQPAAAHRRTCASAICRHRRARARARR